MAENATRNTVDDVEARATASHVFDNLSTETRSFEPSLEFAAHANAHASLYAEAAEDPDGFWGKQAAALSWSRRWTQVQESSDRSHVRWFVGGTLNVAYNCVDRHVEAGNADRVALNWIGEPGDTRQITYGQLQDDVCRAANALKSLGLVAGDRVVIQLPMIPEAVISMLACARLGVIHSVVFGGFSPAALRARVVDAQARVVITSDGQYRRGAITPMKTNIDEALDDLSLVEKVIVVRRTGDSVPMKDGRDIWWDDVVVSQSPSHEPEAFDSEHPLFILYTSGTTGKPKGIVHSSGGYLTQVAYTHRVVFDIKPETDVYWCGADVGWITGHSYIVYGPLANGVTQIMYEGTPNTPHEGRHFEIIEEYGVTVYYIAPTLIRTFMKWGEDIPAAYDLTSLRLLGSVGEPINPEAWMWYREHIGQNRTPIVDTWWQTETGAIMIAPLPGVTATKPGSAQRPIPGISAHIVDEVGQRVPPGEGGYLVVDQPWPSMLRGIWGDPNRAQEVYWERFKERGYYFAGDGAKYDADGDIWLLGRVDDVINVSGHRLSTAEIESALVSHPTVAEAAVVGAEDPTTGQSIVAFVILRGVSGEHDDTVTELERHVVAQIGPIARPRQILIVPELPKTRSGKIMRRLLRDIAENRAVGDTATLADSSTMTAITQSLKASSSRSTIAEKYDETNKTNGGLMSTETQAPYLVAPPFDPEFAGILATWPNSILPTADGIDALRLVVDSALDLLRPLADFDHREINVPGPTGAPDVLLSIFTPSGATETTPAIYYIHGGGMVAGDRLANIEVPIEWIKQFGLKVVSVEYRLAPEHPHPAPVEDSYAGLKWVSEHADELGIDPDKIVVYGPSAGGGIAAGVALLARDRSGPSLAGQILHIPMLDDRNDTVSSHQVEGFGVWDRTSNEVGWTALLGPDHLTAEVSSYAAPARATDLSNLAPAYIDAGSVEVFRDEAVIYASRIWAAGGEAELHIWPGGFHGFENMMRESRLSRASRSTKDAWLQRLIG